MTHTSRRRRWLACAQGSYGSRSVVSTDFCGARRRTGWLGTTTGPMITAITHVHGADLVTRNVRDFEGCGLTVLDPWDL